MNQTNQPDRTSNVPWLTSDPQVRVPDTSMLPDSEAAAPAAEEVLEDAAEGAHDAIDRVADRAAPAVQKLSDGVAAVEETVHAKARQLRSTRDAWAESARTQVRCHPLTAVAAALALGAVLGRIAGSSRHDSS